MPWTDGLVEGTTPYLIAASDNRELRVVAGPGTGKSFAMKRRVARLLESGASPESILPVTFTRVAAEDLHRELQSIGAPGCDRLSGTTLHSLALRILMRNHVMHATGRTPRALNDFELKPLEADLKADHGLIRAVRKKLKAYEAGWARLQHDEPGFVQSEEDRTFSEDLVSWLRFHRAMLIGEVIPQLHQYLATNPAGRERVEFSEILVDEYQDLNKAEQGVIELFSDHARVCIVGDDDQSIYSFKHAHPEGIREWTTNRSGADDLTLTECRRCPTTVVVMANALIRHNRSRPVPRVLAPVDANGRGVVRILQYPTLDQEVAGVANAISDLVNGGTPPGDILVLAQRRVIGTPIYEALVARNIPAKSYYAEAELDAQDAQLRFAILKLFVDREDRVALRWLLGLTGTDWRAASYRRLRDYCDSNRASPWVTLEQLAAGTLRISHTTPLIAPFRAIHERISELEAIGTLEAVIDELFPENADGLRDLRALAINALQTTEGDDREAFLAELSAAIAKPEIPSEVREVRIMSLHKSKGLSAPVTIISGCIEGLLPKQPVPDLSQAEQDADLEEQRRLFYVGISRVKATPSEGKPGILILTYAQEMTVSAAMGSGISPASTSFGNARLLASRFIHELGPSAPRPIAG